MAQLIFIFHWKTLNWLWLTWMALAVVDMDSFHSCHSCAKSICLINWRLGKNVWLRLETKNDLQQEVCCTNVGKTNIKGRSTLPTLATLPIWLVLKLDVISLFTITIRWSYLSNCKHCFMAYRGNQLQHIYIMVRTLYKIVNKNVFECCQIRGQWSDDANGQGCQWSKDANGPRMPMVRGCSSQRTPMVQGHQWSKDAIVKGRQWSNDANDPRMPMVQGCYSQRMAIV